MTVCLPLSAPTATTRPSRLPSLWELSAALQDDSRWVALLAEQLDTDDDHEREQLLAALEQTLAAEDQSREAFLRKADATCWVIGRLRSEATYHQEQSKRFGVLARSETSRADALESRLVQLLTRLEPGSTSFRLVDHQLRSRLSDAVEIDDPDALPADLVTTTTSRSPDKVSIKARIKAAIRTALQRLDGDDDIAAISHSIAGSAVPGARLVQRRHWSIH
jgi:Siphovirus Gp157